MLDEFAALLNRSISEFDKDLAILVVLASFGQNKTYLTRRLALASHMQNLRAIDAKLFTPQEQLIVENTNMILVAQYIDCNGYIN